VVVRNGAARKAASAPPTAPAPPLPEKKAPPDPLSLPPATVSIAPVPGEAPFLNVASAAVGKVGQIAGGTEDRIVGGRLVARATYYPARLIVLKVLTGYAMIVASEYAPGTERFILRANTSGLADGNRLEQWENFRTHLYKVTATHKYEGKTYFVIEPAYVKKP
jgi:hypothetical protein